MHPECCLLSRERKEWVSCSFHHSRMWLRKSRRRSFSQKCMHPIELTVGIPCVLPCSCQHVLSPRIRFFSDRAWYLGLPDCTSLFGKSWREHVCGTCKYYWVPNEPSFRDRVHQFDQRRECDAEEGGEVPLLWLFRRYAHRRGHCVLSKFTDHQRFLRERTPFREVHDLVFLF